jgi:hypothetical protein
MDQMVRTNVLLALVLALAASLAYSDMAAAQKKLSYEQAWAQCKKEISANVPMSDTTTSAARQSAGAACMKKYGYRLKKS